MSKKPRILVVSQHFYPESFRITNIVKAWVESGIDVDVLCGFPNYPDGIWYEGYTGDSPCEEWIDGAHVFRAKEHPRFNNSWKNIFLNYVSWPLYATKRLKDLPGNYDGIFCFNTSPVLMAHPAIKASKRFGAPLTIYVLDIWPENLYTVLPVKSKLMRAVANAVSNRIYAKADKLVAPSDSLAGRLEERLGLDAGSVEVVYQFAEPFYAVPQYDKALHESFPEDFLMVYTGNLSPAQGLDRVLRAYASSLPQLEKDSRLIIVGGGMSKEVLQQICSDLGLDNHVTFYGRIEPEEVPRFTELADAILVSYAPSKELELTIPAKMGSSLAAGKPILGVVGGDSARLLEDYDCGVVANPAELASISHAMESIIAAPKEELNNWGVNSSRCYRKLFASEIAISDLLSHVYLPENRS